MGALAADPGGGGGGGGGGRGGGGGGGGSRADLEAGCGDLGGSDDEAGESSGLLSADAVRLQAQAQVQRAGRASVESSEERERMIKQVETTVGEVNEIFTDLAGLVSDQSGHIDHISSVIENTARAVGGAAEELKVASAYRGRMRSQKCCLYASALIGSFVVLWIMTRSV